MISPAPAVFIGEIKRNAHRPCPDVQSHISDLIRSSDFHSLMTRDQQTTGCQQQRQPLSDREMSAALSVSVGLISKVVNIKRADSRTIYSPKQADKPHTNSINRSRMVNRLS
jgi:hypothetical protein